MKQFAKVVIKNRRKKTENLNEKLNFCRAGFVSGEWRSFGV